jgi:hypothetical protein
VKLSVPVARRRSLAGGVSRSGSRSTAPRRSSSAGSAEVYAAFPAYTDHEIGRVIEAIADVCKLDNPLVI